MGYKVSGSWVVSSPAMSKVLRIRGKAEMPLSLVSAVRKELKRKEAEVTVVFIGDKIFYKRPEIPLTNWMEVRG